MENNLEDELIDNIERLALQLSSKLALVSEQIADLTNDISNLTPEELNVVRNDPACIQMGSTLNKFKTELQDSITNITDINNLQ